MTRALMLAAGLSLAAPTLGSLGCAATRATFAAPRDYAAYRQWVLADGFGEKLAAAWAYLRVQERGEWRDEVARWFFPAEQKFWTEAGRTPGGAAAYLQYLPDGPHAEEERTFLRAWEIEQREGPLRAKKALEEARKKAEVARKALGEAVEAWTRRAIAVGSWREEQKQLEAGAFGDAYFRAPPAPICDQDGCSKYLTFTYPVPEMTTPIDRTAVLEVRVETTAGLLTAVSLVLPKRGFVQWLEGTEGRPIDGGDPSARAESITRARNRVETIVREVRGGACTTDEADEVRRITCGDLRVAIGTSLAGDDVIRIVSLAP
ncbi:MAG: hypothetical protein HYV09_26460 [Deltaproteobacteria bacterium]|nr:hypothetical protein [Deltaproteobacteria bacterium]